jgi:hypothetical protein
MGSDVFGQEKFTCVFLTYTNRALAVGTRPDTVIPVNRPTVI